MKPITIICSLAELYQELNRNLDIVLHQVRELNRHRPPPHNLATRDELLQAWVRERLEECCLLLVMPWQRNTELHEQYVQRLWSVPYELDETFYRHVKVPRELADHYVHFELKGHNLFLYYR